jgi:phosphoribosylformylglycinamidine cyclo-ligase
MGKETKRRNERESYRGAGVDIDAGNALVEAIKPLARATARPGADAGLGGFGALFDLKAAGFRDPILVSTTDGVGTKLLIAIAAGRHETIGTDLVAMCVNDLVVQGAEPLLFLDYFATGRLDVATGRTIIAGIAEACRAVGCALVGGETAEMPGMYDPNEYDLAGFAVGLVEKKRIIDGSTIAPGDAIIGLASSGPHSNGYSLVRKVIAVSGADLYEKLDEARTLGEALLEPTRIYVKPVLALLGEVEVKGLAHITGGGLLENIPRVLPDHAAARLEKNAWQRPAIFDWLQKQGGIEEQEMHRTFNCGLGMVVVVRAASAGHAVDLFARHGVDAWQVGEIVARAQGAPQVVVV